MGAYNRILADRQKVSTALEVLEAELGYHQAEFDPDELTATAIQSLKEAIEIVQSTQDNI